MKSAPRPEMFSGLDIAAGVSVFTGEAFVEIVALGEQGSRLRGQLPPQEVRELALNLIGAADAAENDALVFAVLGRDEESKNMAAALIQEMRRRRFDDAEDPQ